MEYIKIDITDTPWEIACQLINSTIEGVNIFGDKVENPAFDVDELRKIGEHLLNYCITEGGAKK